MLQPIIVQCVLVDIGFDRLIEGLKESALVKDFETTDESFG